MNRAFAVLALVLAPSSALAVDDVSSTVHNLSTTGPGTLKLASAPSGNAELDQICMYCHTPHHGSGSVEVVLWNMGVNTAGYTMYDSTTIDMTIAAQPQTVSMACLSCHDGTIAFDTLLNGPGSGGYNGNAFSRGYSWTAGQNNMTFSAAGELGMDLSDDHPISVTYSTTADTAFNAQGTVEAAGLVFYEPPGGGTANQMECATCHNPHDNSLGTFNRISNAQSAMCLTCHIK